MSKMIYQSLWEILALAILPLFGPAYAWTATTCLPVVPPEGRGNYYFVDANNGDDSYTGRAMEPDPNGTNGPLRTIQTAYDRMKPGDTLYIREGLYRQGLRLTKAASQFRPISIQPFPGHEGRVIISGAEPVLEWHSCPDQASCAGNPHWQHIFYADLDSEVQQVFQDGTRLRPARYPDQGWFYPTSLVQGSTSSFYDRNLTTREGMSAGSTCNIRTAPWHIDQVAVQSYDQPAGRVSLVAPTRYPISLDSGYYFTNVLSHIDQEGQWAFDTAKKRLYLWPMGGLPRNVEVTVRPYGIETHGCSYHVIRGISIRQAYDGIMLHLSSHMLVTENTVDYSFGTGIQASQTTSCIISCNQVTRSGYAGIAEDELCTGSQVVGNYVYGTGAEAPGQDPVNGSAIGVAILGMATRVIGNRIDRCAYDGMYAGRGDTSGREVAYNYITNSCLALADGAGIYTDGHSSRPDPDYFHHNLVADTWGWMGGWARHEASYMTGLQPCVGEGYGIYLDEEGNNRIFQYNTILHCSAAGIFFHWARQNRVLHNTLYGNSACQILLAVMDDPRLRLEDNQLAGNLLIATRAYQKTLRVDINYIDMDLGTSDDNRFYHPTDPRHILVCAGPSMTCTAYTLAGWQAKSGNDASSADLSVPGDPNVRPQIFANPDMSATTIDLQDQTYLDPYGKVVSGSIELGPFESCILFPYAGGQHQSKSR